MSKKASAKIQTGSKRNYLLPALFILLFAGISVYALLNARADSFHTPNLVYIDASKNIKTLGSTFAVPFYSDVPNTPSPVDYPFMRLTVHITSKGPITYAGYKCGSVGPCHTTDSLAPTNGEWKGDVVLCVDVKPSNFGKKRVHLFNIIYKKGVKTGKYEIQHQTIKDPYSCDNTKGPRGGGYYSDTGNYGETGPGYGFSTGANNPGTTGTDSDGSGGGSSGGTTTKTPTDRPNNLPKTSSQGNSKQPELIPSPFYDGKQYKPGSESDNFVVGAVSSTGRAVVNNWPIVLGMLTLVSTAGVLYWKKYRK